MKNKGGSKLCYTGLIISHNGCLKINDKQKDELKLFLRMLFDGREPTEDELNEVS